MRYYNEYSYYPRAQIAQPLDVLQYRTFYGYAAQEQVTGTQFAESAYFPRGHDKRFHANVKLQRGDDTRCMDIISCLIPTKVLSDSGADLTLLTRSTADDLGYDLDTITDNFPVQGIHGAPSEFKTVNVYLQIGNMKPIKIPIGLSVSEDGLYENLMGSKGILDTGKLEAVYNNNGVMYRNSLDKAAANMSFD